MVVTFSAPVFAADMPQRTQAPVYKAVAPSDPWTGCYAGGNVGGAWTTSHDVDVSIIGGDFGSRTASGVVGGGQIGCDYRSGNWVAGIRGLFDVADLNASNVSPINPLVSSGSHFPWFATASGRLGYLVTPATLVYATGGAAWIRSEFSNNAGAPNTLDVTRSGWLAGGGVELCLRRIGAFSPSTIILTLAPRPQPHRLVISNKARKKPTLLCSVSISALAVANQASR